MKFYDLLQFKSKIEKKRHHFDLPSLPDSEWQYMLQEAKLRSLHKEENRFLNLFCSFMSSAKVSFALSFAIILTLMLSFFAITPRREYNIYEKNTSSSNDDNVTTISVPDNSFI